MRWLLAGALAVSVAACSDHILGPTSTLDGIWGGSMTGYQLTFTLTQTDTLVQGRAVLQSIAGYIGFDVTGKMVSHVVTLVATAPNYQPMHYDGTLSSSQAVIEGLLDGSGFSHVAMEMKKR